MGFPIVLLKDDFTNSVQDPVWNGSFTLGSGSRTETGGQGVCTLPSSTAGSHAAYYRTSGTFDLTGDGFVWNIGTMVATGVAATATMDVFIDGNYVLRWQQLSNAITARKIIAGVDTQLYTATWSGTTYKYLKIREASGTIYFDSSSNGTSWTNRASIVGLPFAVTDLLVQFGCSCGNVASPGSLKLDDVNLILPAPSATWRETTADWHMEEPFRPVRLAATANAQGVIVVADAMDSARALSGNVRYFAGPLGSASGGYLALVEYASLALAQASAFQIPVDGRVDLPEILRSRFMRLYHRSTDASNHVLREYLPRRLVQADDIEAESISAINMSAHFITADMIATINLDATAYITAGAGSIVLNDTGIKIILSSGFDTTRAFRFTKTDGTIVGLIDGYYTGSNILHRYLSQGTTGETVDLQLWATAASGSAGAAEIRAKSGTTNAVVQALVNAAGTASVGLDAGSGTVGITSMTQVISKGLTVGSGALSAASGEIATSGNVGVGAAVSSAVRLFAKGVDTGTSNYAFNLQDSAGTNLMIVRNDGAVTISKSGGTVGFYAGAGAAKQTVTGSRGGNAALASLLSALAAYGLVTDSSSA